MAIGCVWCGVLNKVPIDINNQMNWVSERVQIVEMCVCVRIDFQIKWKFHQRECVCVFVHSQIECDRILFELRPQVINFSTAQTAAIS